MSQFHKSQFIHRLTGADFHPRRRSWVLPVIGAVVAAAGMYYGWM